MKSRKIITNSLLIIITIFTSINTTIAQQDQRQGPPRVPNAEQLEKMIDKLSVDLKLDAEQKSKLLELHKAHFKEVKAMMEKHKEQHQSHKQEMDALREQFESEVKKHLTKEQVIAFDEFRENHKPQKEGQQKR